jgi:transcriptional regulator with XRE-family HTH domain
MPRVTKGEKLAAMLEQARRAKGLTQVEMMSAVGLRQPVSVSRYENGHAIPDPPVFERIIAELDLDADKAWELWGLAYAERTRRALKELGG